MIQIQLYWILALVCLTSFSLFYLVGDGISPGFLLFIHTVVLSRITNVVFFLKFCILSRKIFPHTFKASIDHNQKFGFFYRPSSQYYRQEERPDVKGCVFIYSLWFLSRCTPLLLRTYFHRANKLAFGTERPYRLLHWSQRIANAQGLKNKGYLCMTSNVRAPFDYLQASHLKHQNQLELPCLHEPWCSTV